LAAGVALHALAAPAALADEPPSPAPSTAPAAGREEFGKGTESLSLYGAYVHDYQHGGDFGLGSVGYGYYVADRFAVGAEIRGFGISQDGPDAVAVEGNLFIRHHLIVSDPWSLYLDGAVGVFYADHEVPTGGTHFNFMEDTGLGATYRLDDGVYLMGGVRYLHISNARIDGADRNPAINGLEGYFGVMFTF
jgi:hypothetical protein